MEIQRNHLLDCIKRDLLFFWIAAAAALCLGLFINQFRGSPLPLDYADKEQRLDQAVVRLENRDQALRPTPGEAQLPQTVSLEEFEKIVKQRSALILDARPEIFHRLGHVPGAISLPRKSFEKSYQSLRAELEKDFAQPIVIYCSSNSCEDAELVRNSLVKLGFTQVAVYPGGWAGWTNAGNKEESNL